MRDTPSLPVSRTSFTVPQVNEVLGTWAYKSGTKKAYTMVSDFGPDRAHLTPQEGYVNPSGQR